MPKWDKNLDKYKQRERERERERQRERYRFRRKEEKEIKILVKEKQIRWYRLYREVVIFNLQDNIIIQIQGVWMKILTYKKLNIIVYAMIKTFLKQKWDIKMLRNNH